MSGPFSQTYSTRYSDIRAMSSSDNTFDQYSPLDNFESAQLDFEQWEERVENSAQLYSPQNQGYGPKESFTKSGLEYTVERRFSSPRTYDQHPPQTSQMSQQNLTQQQNDHMSCTMLQMDDQNAQVYQDGYRPAPLLHTNDYDVPSRSNRYLPGPTSPLDDQNSSFQPSVYPPHSVLHMDSMASYTQYNQSPAQATSIQNHHQTTAQQLFQAIQQPEHQHSHPQFPEYQNFQHLENHSFQQPDLQYAYGSRAVAPTEDWHNSNAGLADMQSQGPNSITPVAHSPNSNAMVKTGHIGQFTNSSPGRMAVAQDSVNTVTNQGRTFMPLKPTKIASNIGVSSQIHDGSQPPSTNLVDLPQDTTPIVSHPAISDRGTKKRKIRVASDLAPPSLETPADVDSETEEPKTKRLRMDGSEEPAEEAPVATQNGRESKKKAAVEEATKPALPSLNEHGMFFDSYDDAATKLDALNWPARDDPGLPKSPENRREIVKELLAAMNDMTASKDKAGPVFQNRWLRDGDAENAQGSSTGAGQFYEPWRKEKKCWEILDMLEKLYREGTHFITILDPKILQEAAVWRELTFLQRKKKFVELLKSYKSRVDKLMRGPCLEEYVLTIGKLIKQSKANRENNDRRGEDLVEGRKREDRVLKRLRRNAKTPAIVARDDNVSSNENDLVTPGPSNAEALSWSGNDPAVETAIPPVILKRKRSSTGDDGETDGQSPSKSSRGKSTA